MAQISIIIPVYNSEIHLPLCLDSVLAQTFEDWEAICINDGSTDGSGGILAEYAARDSRIRVFTQGNRGQGFARNFGLSKACGQYFSFLDSDDYLSADFLESLHAKAQSCGADVVVGTTCYESFKRVRQSNIEPDTPLNTFVERVNALPHGAAWDKLYHAEFLRQHDITFPEDVYWEDNPFTVSVCYYAQKIVAEPGAIYHYRLGEESTTRGVARAAKRKADSLIVAKDMMDFCRTKKCNEEEIAAVSDFCQRNFISTENLVDTDYYTEVQHILGSSVQLAARKALRRERRKKLCNRVRRIVTLGVCPRTNTWEGRGQEPFCHIKEDAKLGRCPQTKKSLS